MLNARADGSGNHIRSFVNDYLIVGRLHTATTSTRAVLTHTLTPNTHTASTPRRAFLNDYLLVGRADTSGNHVRSFVNDYLLVGTFSTSSVSFNSRLLNTIDPAFYGMSFVLSDRQIIREQVGLRGLSFVLSDRQIIKQQVGAQGLAFVLSDQQPFNFQFGFNAVNIEAKDEQWFEPSNGMDGVDVELSNPNIGRGYIIKK